MGKKENVHTVPNKDGKGWVNKVNGEVTSRHRKKRTATEEGRKEAKQNESDHRIHRKDGTIGEANSYGNDPHPPDG